MIDKHVVTGADVPQSSLPFSPGILSSDFLFISGQASVDKEGKIVNGTFEEECRRSFENLGIILKAAGLGYEDVVQVRNYLGDQKDLPAFNQIYREFFKEPFPARTTIMGCLGDILKFEVEAIARKK